MVEEKKQEEIKEEQHFGFYVATTPTEYQKLIVKDGKEVDLLELLVDIANKVDRAGLK
jgi:hypothetical protein